MTLTLSPVLKNKAMSPANASSATPGRLLSKLPLELRPRIYEMMFPPESIDIFPFRGYLVQIPRYESLVAGDHVAVLATCHQVHDEATPVLYADTRFNIHCSWGEKLGPYSATKEVRDEYDDWTCRESLQMNDGDSEIFVQLQQAHSITLNITIDGSDEKRWPCRWMQRLPVEISGVLGLKKLHIALFVEQNVDCDVVQDEVDHTMAVLGGIRCKAAITSVMEVSFADAGFEMASYHTMLDKVKGVDTTPELHKKQLADLLTELLRAKQDLDSAKARSISLSKRLVAIQEDNTHWSEQHVSTVGVRQLMESIRMALGEICRLEATLKSLAGRIKALRILCGVSLIESEALSEAN